MRDAYIRALNHNSKNTIISEFCNSCKASYQIDAGEIVDVITLESIYKIWYCLECILRESEYV